VVTSDLDELASAVRRLLGDPDLAATYGAAARSAALARYGLGRFLADWDDRLRALVPASV
jgi:glycosyltransferase involved in cell wall biosynthesis